jgi:hypothetical protein
MLSALFQVSRSGVHLTSRDGHHHPRRLREDDLLENSGWHLVHAEGFRDEDNLVHVDSSNQILCDYASRQGTVGITEDEVPSG